MRRPPAKWPDATTKTVVTYAYNGAGRVAKVQYGDAGLRLNYWGSSETDDNYQHYDRFGRIGTQKWEDYTPTVTVVDQFDYTHDYAGNRLTRDIPASLYATNDKDQVYTYDLLHRLKTFDEGTLVGTSISGTPKKEEDWTLDALGNWTGLIKKTNGTTDLNQTRAHNDVNEVGTISATVGTNWADPTHDDAGNTTLIPKPSAPANGYTLTYDAWNRLVEVKDGANVVATCEYDGRNYRIIKVDVAADPDKTYHYYYNESWQCLEMRLDASTSPKEQYFWGTHYIDALAVRYWDSNGDTDFLDTDEVQYYSHDANFNVTGVYTTAGVAAERYRYTPYGDLLVLDANFANDADGVSDFANATTFTGRLLDTEYGQYYFRNRYYGSWLGRFGARDPIGYADGLNLYAGYFVPGGIDPFGEQIPPAFDAHPGDGEGRPPKLQSSASMTACPNISGVDLDPQPVSWRAGWKEPRDELPVVSLKFTMRFRKDCELENGECKEDGKVWPILKFEATLFGTEWKLFEDIGQTFQLYACGKVVPLNLSTREVFGGPLPVLRTLSAEIECRSASVSCLGGSNGGIAQIKTSPAGTARIEYNWSYEVACQCGHVMATNATTRLTGEFASTHELENVSRPINIHLLDNMKGWKPWLPKPLAR